MQPRSRAFTLVELLVVIGIIGLLLALILPAIFASRQAAKRTECINNQRQLALAVIASEQINGKYPGYRNILATNAQGSLRSTGWVFPLLPHLEERAVFDAHGRRGGDADRGVSPNYSLAGLVCPSDTIAIVKASTGWLDGTSYVANTGQKDASANELFPGDWRTNGIFVERFPVNDAGEPVRNETVTAKYVSTNDGLSKTLLLSENVDAGFWSEAREYHVGFVWEPTIVDGRPRPESLLAINERAGEHWASLTAQARGIQLTAGLCCSSCGPRPPGRPRPANPGDSPIFPDQPDAPTGTSAGQGDFRFARPSSHHDGGVIVAYADAHTNFLRDDVDYLTYCALMTPAGAKASMPASFSPVPEPYRSATTQGAEAE